MKYSDVDEALLILLAAIDNSLTTGSHMSGGNLALEYLCLRLGVDRDALQFRPGWVSLLDSEGRRRV